MKFDIEQALGGSGSQGGAFGFDVDEALGTKKKKRERTWGEAATDTAVQLAEGVNTIAGAVPNLVAPESDTAEFFNRNADFWREKQSEPIKERIAQADRAIDAAGEDGIISQISEAAGQYFSDPALAARFVTTNLPSMIPGLAATKLTHAAALARGASAARAASLATTAGGATNAVLNAGGARGDAFQDIKRTLEAQGYSSEQAEEMALRDSRVAAAVGAATGFLSGKTGLEGSIVGKVGAGGALKAGGRAAAAELAGEQIEEVTPKLTTNYLASEYDDRSIGQDVGRTIVETAIGSGPGSIVAGGSTAMNARALASDPAGEPDQQPTPRQAETDAVEAATASESEPASQIEQGIAQRIAEAVPTRSGSKNLRPEARLAELDILKIYRPLNEVEVQESIALLQEIQDRESGGQPAIDVDPLASPQSAQPQAPSFDDARMAADQAGAVPSDDGLDTAQMVQTPSEVRTENRDGTVSVATWTPQPDGRLLRQVRTEPAGQAAPADFWSFAQTKGFTPGQIQVGSPEHAALKAEYDALKAGARAADPAIPAGSSRSALPAIDVAIDRMSPSAQQSATMTMPAMPASVVSGIDPALQNRDRSRAASVAQMADIAMNPDYMRLATSRTPDAGAPMVFAVGDDTAKIPAANLGNADVAVMSDGQRVPFRYAVVDARAVEPSNFADGRANPAFGANAMGTIKALNNGRTAGLRAAYEQGTAGNYQAELIADAAAHGVPVEAIQRTPNPILVRVYSEQSNTPDMAAKSQGQGLGMSPTELASQDASLIDASVLTAYQAGEIASAANRDFVRAFVGKLSQAGQDVAGMMTADGSLSPAGRQRIQAALMQAAYGDADLVTELFDSLDTDIKAIGEALKTVAGEWANMRDSARQGLINPDADITDNLVQAVNLVRKARRDNVSLYDLANQTDLMTGQTPDELTISALRFFYPSRYMTRAAGRESIVTVLRDYTRSAMGTTAGADMFGQVVTPGDILNGIADQGAINAQDSTQEGSRGADGRGLDGSRPDAAWQGNESIGTDRAGREAGEDRQGERGQGADGQAQRAANPGDQGRGEGDAAATADAIPGQRSTAQGEAGRLTAESQARLDALRREALPIVRTGAYTKQGITFDQNGQRTTVLFKGEPIAIVEGKRTRESIVKAIEGELAQPDDILSAYTPQDVIQRQDAAEAEQRQREASDRTATEQDRQRQEREEIRRRSEAAADDFQLGQDPMANLTGQRSVFDAVPEDAKPARQARTQQPAADERIQDVGEQLYANRRNFTGRGLKWEDVEGLNDTLKVKEVTKAKVWPRPNYEQLVADGMPPVLARMVKHVYDGLSAGPTIKTGTPPTDADLKRYIDTLAKVREGLFGFVNDRQLVADFAKGVLTMVKGEATALGPVSILDMAKQSMDAREISTVLLRRVWPEQFAANVPTMGRFTRGSEAQKDVSIIGGNKAIGALQFDRNDISKWVGDLGKGWPAKREAWQVQGYRVLSPGEYTAAGQEQADGTTRMSIRPKEGRGSWRATFTDEQLANAPFVLVQDGGFGAQLFATKESAIEAAREKVKRAPGAGQDIRGTNIEEAERTGPARRQDGEDITPQRLMDIFGFRGVNFGREGWIKQAERQEYLNQAYDGLMDLAEILGVPAKAMSLDGKLGIAFGAQGKGGAHAAHFVPGYNEINLTKTKGAGTLAHEWGHALDHHFATLAALEKDKEPFLSEHANQPDTRDRMVFEGGKYVRKNLKTFGDGIRPEIVQAFRAIYQAMEKRNESPGEMATRRESAKAGALKRLDGWIKAARRQIEESAADNKADLLSEFDQHAEKFRLGDTGDGYEKAGKQVFSARVAAVRNLIKDATGRLWSADETNGLEQNASYVKSLLGKQDADTTHEPQKVATQYKADSAAMDKEKGGKAYWATPTEMFARAFELYVHDKLSQREQRNTFLTDAEQRASKPVQVADESSAMARGAGAVRDLYLYPVGKERETLREAFDNLVGQIKTRDTERGVSIYSTTGRSIPLTAGQRVVESAVTDEIEQRIGQFAHQPTIVIRDSAEGVLPGATKADGVAGAVHEGRIFLFLDQMATRADVQETLFHELFHYGVRKIFTRDQFIQEMRTLYDRDAWVKARADAWVKTPEGKAAAQYGGDEYALARGVDETLARLAEPNAGTYTRTDAFSRAIVSITRWLADLAQRLGFTQYAAKLRGIKNQEARELIQRVFRTLETQANPEHAGWMDDAEPAFSRNSIGGNEPPQPGPAQENAWTRAKAKAMELTSPAALDKLIYDFQDKYIDLKRLREHIKAIGGTITDLNDAYLREELYHKRLAKRTEDFLDKELRPLLADMRNRSVALPELERYLHARHAPEANKELAKRNPTQAMIEAGKADAARKVRELELQLQRARANNSATRAIETSLEEARDQAAIWNGAQAFRGTEAERLSLSGMSDAEAKAYMDGLTPRQREHMEALAAKVDAMQAKTLDTLEDYGLIDKATVNGWRSSYRHYVPLHRDEARAESDRHPIGMGFSVKGTGMKSRVGSNEKVTNILTHIVLQREVALTRGEKNTVTKSLYLMAAQNPDESFWEIDSPPKLKTIDPRNGFVRTGVDPTYKNKPNVVMVRIAGRDQAIVFNERNPNAVRLAESMKNMDVGDLHVLLNLAANGFKWFPFGTRWFAQVNTQWNPIFGVINFARDVQAAALNLSTTELAGKESEVASPKQLAEAMRAIYRERRGKSVKSREWTRLWNELQEVGGTTGYRDLFADTQARADGLVKEIKALDRGQVSKAAHAVVDWLSDYNEVLENTVRLSAYKVALDQGMTKERAASLAKNLTVNFNRKGRLGRELGAAYAFFNAALQGTARMVETLRGPMGKKIMYGGVMLGAVNTLIGMAMMGGDDEDEADNWAQIPEFIKERSIIIPLGREDYLTIPMPLGFHVFPNIGRMAVEFALGGSEKTAGGMLGKMMMILADSFNPLGSATDLSWESAVGLAMPTVVDPIWALAINKDWTGKPIYRENPNSLDSKPGHQMAKDSASTFSATFSEAMNKVTGGTEYRPGAWSPNPDQLDYVIGQLTGGLGREVMKVDQSIRSVFTGDELPPYKIPLAGRLYGNTRGPAGQSEQFYANVKLLNEIENEYKGRLRNNEDVQALRDSEPLLPLVPLANQYGSRIRKLRDLRRQVVERKEDGYQDRARELDQEIGDTMTNLNKAVSKARKEAVQ